jgi:hypothetical protein
MDLNRALWLCLPYAYGEFLTFILNVGWNIILY